MKKIISLASVLLVILSAMAVFFCTASASGTQVMFAIDDISGKAGDTLTLPLKIVQNTGVWGFQISLFFDENLFEYLEVDATNSQLADVYDLNFYFKEPHEIRIQSNALNMQANTATGTLCDIRLHVKDTAPTGGVSLGYNCYAGMAIDIDGDNTTASFDAPYIKIYEESFSEPDDNGNIHYQRDGENCDDFSGFVQKDGQTVLVQDGILVQEGDFLFNGKYHVINGVRAYDTRLYKHTDGKYYYLYNGEVTAATMLFKHTDGKYYYVKDGVVTKSTLLFKHTDNKWYYIKSGVVTKATLLFKHTDGKFYYIKNGVKTNATLLFKHTDGKYYYVKNGVVTKSTLLFKHTDNKWYYIKNGVVTKSTLLFKHTDSKFYYIKNGIKTKATLLFKHTDGKYYYVKDGVVAKSTLLFKHTDGKYYYIKNGVMTKATLIYKFNGKGRYVKNGIWQSGFSGKVKISGKTYTIKKGNVA